MRDPLTRCFWVGVVVLSVGWALLVPLVARSAPPGSGWAQLGVCADDSFLFLPAPPPHAGATVIETFIAYPDGSFEGPLAASILGSPGAVCPGFASTVFFRYLPPPVDPPPARVFSWSSPADVLQLLLWGAVPLVGFWGYSLGARE